MDSSIIYRFLFVFLIFTSTQLQAIEFQGKFIQGHFILGKTNPNAKIIVGKKEVKISSDGFFVFGIDRDRKFDLTFTKILELIQLHQHLLQHQWLKTFLRIKSLKN